MSLTPRQRFELLQRQKGFTHDISQVKVVEQLQRLHQQILDKDQQIKGLYLWGDVGRGKTMLMDVFYNSLPQQTTLRLHFHRFMAKVHSEMQGLNGQRDPLKIVATQIAKQYRVICFDEFFVSDIGDAMILGRLFEALFEQGVVLVATSNTPVEKLYENGLARDRFLPFIGLLQGQTESIHLDGDIDHRLRQLTSQQTYFLHDEINLKQLFDTIKEEQTSTSTALTILGRQIPVIERSTNCLWVSFDALCDGPRSQLDYIELASQFSSMLISHIPPLGGVPRSWIRARGTEDGTTAVEAGARQLHYAPNDDPARRFIALVDELYDQQVNLYLHGELPLEHLYTPGALAFEFKRTMSRLIEMQSVEYLHSQNQP